MRKTIRLTTIFLVLLALSWQVARPERVAAHAALLQAEPPAGAVLEASPPEVVLWFTEPVEPSLSEIVVLNAAGEQVDNGDSRPDENDATILRVTLPPLPDGTYTVSWRNVSTVDGHAVRGSYLFHVGETAPPAGAAEAPVEEATALPVAEAVVRWLLFAGILTVAGGLSFALFVLRPALARGFPAGVGGASLAQKLSRRILLLAWVGMGLFLLALLAQLYLQAAAAGLLDNLAEAGPNLLAFLTGTYWGRMWVVRLALFMLLAAFLPAPAGEPRTDHQSISFLFALGVLLTLSLISHAAATAGIEWPAVLSDFVHLLAAGLWVGGLFHFAAGLPIMLGTLEGAERRDFLSTLTRYFSALAIVCVGALTLTGLFSAYAQVTVPAALRTPYGTTLLVKLALMVPLLLLGAANLLRLGPRLAHETAAGRNLRQAVSLEALLGLLVLLVVGLLVTLEPARQVATRLGLGGAPAVTLETESEGAVIQLAVDPAEAGENELQVLLTDRRGEPLTNANDVILGVFLPGENIAPPVGRAENVAPGRYSFADVPLSVSGEWQVDVHVTRPDAFDAHGTFLVDVAPPGMGGIQQITPSPQLAGTLFAITILLLLVLAFLVWRFFLPRPEQGG